MVEFDVPADKVDYVTCGTCCKSVRLAVVCAKTSGFKNLARSRVR
jgi:hypothetical protein